MPFTVYKLTRPDLTTKGNTLWTPGEWKEAPGVGPLCTSGWLHYYEDPLLALLFNPIHSNIAAPRLWEAEADGALLRDGDCKAGASRLRIVRELLVPEITHTQRIAWGIYCAEPTATEKWRVWAEKWLSGEDRTSASAAYAAAAAAAYAAASAAYAAAYASAYAYAYAAAAAAAADAPAVAPPSFLLHCAFRAMEV